MGHEKRRVWLVVRDRGLLECTARGKAKTCLALFPRHHSPVNTKKPTEQKRPDRKELKGKEPTVSM